MRLISDKRLWEKLDTARSTGCEIRSRGLLPKPTRFGRCNLTPEHEVDQIIAARLAGATDDEIRGLVRRLMAERKQAADVAA